MAINSIVLADDESIQRDTLSTIIQRYVSADIRLCSNGRDALSLIEEELPDLLITDIRMPVMNGIQATAKIRAISQEIPIIAITAYAFCPEGERALEAGCNEVIAKPYPLEKLKETIETYL